MTEIIIPIGAVPTEKDYGYYGDIYFRGKPIMFDDVRIPLEVYHVTTNKPLVEQMKIIKASGVGGLGGDERDRIVSFTTDRNIAEQIADDLRLAVRMAKKPIPEDNTSARIKYGEAILDELIDMSHKEGWDFNPDYLKDVWILKQYDAMDYLSQYFAERENKGGIHNPIIHSSIETLRKVDPDKIGVIIVPKEALKTGALLTDFDLGKRYGLNEVRLYGDAPVEKMNELPKRKRGHGPKSLVSVGQLQ